jgi:hypothetical protein
MPEAILKPILAKLCVNPLFCNMINQKDRSRIQNTNMLNTIINEHNPNFYSGFATISVNPSESYTSQGSALSMADTIIRSLRHDSLKHEQSIKSSPESTNVDKEMPTLAL